MGKILTIFWKIKNTIFDLDLYGLLRNKVLDIFYRYKEVNTSQIANELQLDSNKVFKYLLVLDNEG